MPKAVPLRDDYSADELRELARRTHDAKQARRLLALAGVDEGLRRSEAARLGAMDAQALRRWVLAFNAEGPAGWVNSPPPGRSSKLSPAQKQEMAQFVDAGPNPEQNGVVRWRCVDLQQIIRDHYGVDVAENSVGRLLKALGFAYVSARIRKRSTFLRNQTRPERVTAIADTLPPGTPIELWFQDEIQVG